MSQDEYLEADMELVEQALAGQAEALGQVGEMLRDLRIPAMLRKRGASNEEADEVVSQLAEGCFAQTAETGQLRDLLGKYSGKGPLAAYLNRVALFRFISIKKGEQRKPKSVSLESGSEEGLELQVGGLDSEESEDVIVELLQDALVKAFSEVDQEKLLLFRLVTGYHLKQKRVGEMWGWHETKVARSFGVLREEIRDRVLENIHKQDPWLTLTWEDFLSLCGESVDLFDFY